MRKKWDVARFKILPKVPKLVSDGIRIWNWAEWFPNLACTHYAILPFCQKYVDSFCVQSINVCIYIEEEKYTHTYTYVYPTCILFSCIREALPLNRERMTNSSFWLVDYHNTNSYKWKAIALANLNIPTSVAISRKSNSHLL